MLRLNRDQGRVVRLGQLHCVESAEQWTREHSLCLQCALSFFFLLCLALALLTSLCIHVVHDMLCALRISSLASGMFAEVLCFVVVAQDLTMVHLQCVLNNAILFCFP